MKPRLDGNTRPVALPPAALALARPPHWIPNSRLKLLRASTMRASIVICGVWVSSRRARSMTSLRLALTSLTISELVRLSTSILPFGDSSGASLVARSSALA
jgi:hypothetical protein